MTTLNHQALAGRRALVSGSTAGIGYAIAQALAEQGAAVMLNGRDAGRTEQAVRRLQQALPSASLQGVAADLATATGADTVVRAAGEVDILINNLSAPFQPVKCSLAQQED